jgi:hypothetical protein
MENAQPARCQGLYSLDALRGFDMVWIIGLTSGDFTKESGSCFRIAFSKQFEHPVWNE